MSSPSQNSDSIDSQNSNNHDDNAEDLKISKEFQENVIKFTKIDDLMRQKQKELTELRNQRKPCEEFIIKYLDQIDEQVIEISNGKLRKNKSETKVPINQDIIKEAIETKVKDPKIVSEIIEAMDELRPKNVRVNLKRTYAREKKANKKATATK